MFSNQRDFWFHICVTFKPNFSFKYGLISPECWQKSKLRAHMHRGSALYLIWAQKEKENKKITLLWCNPGWSTEEFLYCGNLAGLLIGFFFFKLGKCEGLGPLAALTAGKGLFLLPLKSAIQERLRMSQTSSKFSLHLKQLLNELQGNLEFLEMEANHIKQVWGAWMKRSHTLLDFSKGHIHLANILRLHKRNKL